MPIDLTKIKAIDVHVHAEVSCHDPEDPVMGQYFDAASAYFKAPRERPKMPEIADIYREQQIAFCMFTVDCESGIGAKRVSNYEVAEFALKNDDICMAFASIDPHKGKLGAREARDLVENYGVKGFKFHGIMQNAHPADRMAYPIYEVIAEYKLPAIFHTGHSGMGTGMRGGGGVRLKYGQPMLIDDVAVDFPDMQIILAHPSSTSWPKPFRRAAPAVRTKSPKSRRSRCPMPPATSPGKAVRSMAASSERWGSISRTYIECSQDRAIPLSSQRKMQEMSPGCGARDARFGSLAVSFLPRRIGCGADRCDTFARCMKYA